VLCAGTRPSTYSIPPLKAQCFQLEQPRAAKNYAPLLEIISQAQHGGIEFQQAEIAGIADGTLQLLDVCAFAVNAKGLLNSAGSKFASMEWVLLAMAHCTLCKTVCTYRDSS
jgi:hypothetical protein